jgi:hypothetical protein
MERTNIMIAPTKFLGTVQKLRISENEYPRSCLDETWISETWSLKILPQKGSRLTVSKVESGKIGLICEGMWIFLSAINYNTLIIIQR